MPSAEMLEKYAETIIKVGVGLGPGDRLVLTAPTGALEFTRQVVEAGYKVGAANVDVILEDDTFARARFAFGNDEAAGAVTGLDRMRNTAAKGGDFDLRLVAANPDLFTDLDPERISAFDKVSRETRREATELYMSDQLQWCGAGAATPTWAGLVFPELSGDEALEALWDAIFRVCRIDQDDPIAAWEAHNNELAARSAYLNARSFDALRYEGPGTALVMGLPNDHVWSGGQAESAAGRPFNPNMPTEEVFTAPHRLRGGGVVRSTKPVLVAGKPVDGLVVEVEGGKVTRATATEGQDILDETLATDEGALRFGEVALVPQSSAVARENLIWHHMLFDENDACHIAFGAAYPISVHGGTEMTEEQRSEAGLNSSLVHLDFVVGSPELSVYGVNAAGSEELLLENGEWAFDL